MRASSGSGPLAGRNVLVTRPAHQADSLARLIEAAGGSPVLFPTIEIIALHSAQLARVIDHLDGFACAIFVSPNAVNAALLAIAARRALPPGLEFAAVGLGSVKALERFGIRGVVAPARFDSEALLEMPALREVAGRRIVIFRGEGGRELLGETLAARGALVEYASCYQRCVPQADVAPLLAAAARGDLHAITVTSSEGVRNLLAMTAGRDVSCLLALPVFAPHARIAAAARDCGFANVVTTAQGDAGLVEGLCDRFGGKT